MIIVLGSTTFMALVSGTKPNFTAATVDTKDISVYIEKLSFAFQKSKAHLKIVCSIV